MSITAAPTADRRTEPAIGHYIFTGKRCTTPFGAGVIEDAMSHADQVAVTLDSGRLVVVSYAEVNH